VQSALEARPREGCLSECGERERERGRGHGTTMDASAPVPSMNVKLAENREPPCGHRAGTTMPFGR
jgi:hypothetical protein